MTDLRMSMTSYYELESLGTSATRKTKKGQESSRKISYRGAKRGKPVELVGTF